MHKRPPIEMYHPYADGWFWVSAITRIAVLVLLIVGIVLLVRYLSHRYPPGSYRAPGAFPPSGHSSAMQILEERFARGEIDEKEFRTRKEALRA